MITKQQANWDILYDFLYEFTPFYVCDVIEWKEKMLEKQKKIDEKNERGYLTLAILIKTRGLWATSLT